MTTVSSTSNSLYGQTTTAGKTGSAGMEDRFLKLLVTQLQNQDPLNPMDNAQTTSQMAQISTVSGIEKLNKSIENMATALASAQAFQAASLVGRTVLSDGKSLSLSGGKATAGMELAADADSVVVRIKDKNGNLMQEVDLGAQQAGLVNFQWDGSKDGGGMAADGEYTFEVKAVQGGKTVDASPLAYGRVGSLTFDSSGITLQVAGLGSIAMADIRQIM